MDFVLETTLTEANFISTMKILGRGKIHMDLVSFFFCKAKFKLCA